uniref:E3 SUMO-protein ligase NSE2 n=1 Tax=Caenorhabditis tropicalis TaxID=1561998 RepID=A0A1I7UUB1_9PELO
MEFHTEVEELDAEAVKLEGTFTSLVETYKQPDLEIPNEAAYKKAYNKAAKGHKKDGAHPYYKEARKIIAELTNNLEEADDTADLQVEQVQHSRKDPISKKDIVNPVINTACGHVYDRDSIIQFAGTKRSIKCVMQGCSQNITIKNLSDYPEFWTNIKQQE